MNEVLTNHHIVLECAEKFSYSLKLHSHKFSLFETQGTFSEVVIVRET
jgi:hypothetical protein